LGELIIEHRFAVAKEVYRLLSSISGLDYIDLETIEPQQEAVQLLTESECLSLSCLPWRWEGPQVYIAMADPENIVMQDKIKHIIHDRFGTLIKLKPFYCQGREIHKAVYTLFHEDPWPEANISATDTVNTILKDAVLKNASDIHIQPEEGSARIRLRIDGHLQNYRTLSLDDMPFIVNRIKVLSNLNITETRRPQSGSFQNIIAGHDVDIRVSIHCTTMGESTVLRILDKSRPLRTLEELGFDEEECVKLRQSINQPHGLILCCGPTGSGKTTTLYALLQEINHSTRNVMTLEDPVEYVIPGIRQSQVQGDVSFADGVRSLLRHDPDVILIGEIRDSETAQIAIRAALTGHLVLSSVHTADVWSIPARLMDLGVSPIQLTGQIICGVNQRLVANPCPKCGGEKCKACKHTGVEGRRVDAEVILFSTPMQRAIAKGADALSLRDASRLSSGTANHT
jgi:type II secretory ATPase GspE/PulE/Tfp pilus assembly ATPase PilB-like protein